MRVKSTQIAARLREARRQRGLSQDELATAAGLKQSAVSHYESGRRTPSVEHLVRLAEALEISVEFLIGVESSPSYSGGVSAELASLLEKLPKKDVELLRLLARELMKRRSEN